MGNQLKKEYDVNLDVQNGSGGLGLRWKLYDAVDLKTKEECTIFTFSKKDLPKTLRKESERFLTLLKKEVERGYKFKHPNCLRVIKPIKEFRGELAFVTERVMCSLANILGDTVAANEDNTVYFTLPPHLKNYKFGALQLRSGLAQLCDAALFMHNDAHMAHGFIDPCNVYITPTGDWKLFGFHFAEHVATENDEAHLGWDFTNDKELPFYPPFECLAPEIMISNILTVKSDVFSIGRIAYLLHRQQAGIRRDKVIKSADEYRRYINHLNLSQSHISVNGRDQGIPFEGIPENLVDTLKQTLRTDEKLRCKVQDVINCKYLNDMIVRVIRYLEKLLDKEEDGRIKFLKKLPEEIDKVDRYRVNQLNRKDTANDSDKAKSFDTPKVKDSMDSILEKEFDPNKKGEKHKKPDDPFAAQPNDTTSLSPSNPFAQSPTTSNNGNAMDDEVDLDNNDNANTGFGGFGDNSFSSPTKPAVTSFSNNNSNSSNNTKPAPPVYGTKSAILTNTNNKTESFGWGNNDEQDTSFITTSSDQKSNEQTKVDNAFSSFTVTPFAASSNDNSMNQMNTTTTQQAPKITPPSTADFKSKRRVRTKGKIKKNTGNSPNPATMSPAPGSGGVPTGFGNNNASNASSSTSAFGFMNNSNSNNNNMSSMFSNYDYTTTTTTDTTSGFGHMFGNTNSTNNAQQPGAQKVESKPMFSSQPAENDMFSGMQTNYGKDEDIFAGLGHSHQGGTANNSNNNNNNNNQMGAANIRSGGGGGGGNQSAFGFMNNSNNNQASNTNVNQMFMGNNNQPASNNGNPFGLDLGNTNNSSNKNNNANDPFAGMF